MTLGHVASWARGTRAGGSSLNQRPPRGNWCWTAALQRWRARRRARASGDRSGRRRPGRRWRWPPARRPGPSVTAPAGRAGVEAVRQCGEERTVGFSAGAEATQPAPHRRGVDVQLPGGSAVAVAGGPGHQGDADHLDAVPAPAPAVSGEENVGGSTSAAAGSPRTTALLAVAATHDTHSGSTPRPQSTGTARAGQLRARLRALRFLPSSRVPPGTRKGPPVTRSEMEREGVCAYGSSARCRLARRRATRRSPSSRHLVGCRSVTLPCPACVAFNRPGEGVLTTRPPPGHGHAPAAGPSYSFVV